MKLSRRGSSRGASRTPSRGEDLLALTRIARELNAILWVIVYLLSRQPAVIGPALALSTSLLSTSSQFAVRQRFSIMTNTAAASTTTSDAAAMHSEDFLQFMSFAVAFMRAVDHARPDHIVDDPFAEPLIRQITPQLAPRMEKWTKDLPSPENYIAIRTRYLDETVSQRAPCIRQVVLFRAGLGTRAYRLESLRDCHVFEIDQSIELFEHKVGILDALGAELIPHKHNIIVADVKDVDWDEKLLSSGFDSHTPTFWALEGVTMYLERASNVALLKTIDILSAPGSEIWGDVGGQALKDGGVAALQQVDALSQAELGTQLFRLGEDDAIHGVFGELPWELELQADLAQPGVHFGRHWGPIPAGTSSSPVPFSFVHGRKPSSS